MQRRDVIVVGGGPAGSTCAWALGRLGLSVTVLDRATFPRDKLCTGWITPPVVTALDLDLEDYRRGRVLESFHGFRTSLIGHRGLTTEFGHTVSYGICRREFDAYLLGRARAERVEGSAVQSLRRENGTWIVNETWQTPLLIGAGGHFCPVSRVLNPFRDPRVVVARDIEVPVDEALSDGPARAGIPELYFCPDLRGYGWIVVKQGVVSIGLGREDPRRLDRHVDEFLSRMRDEGLVRPTFSPRWRGHAYVLAPSSARTAVADGVLLVGDAAGLAAQGSGEGIRTAVESGLLASSVVARSRGDYRADSLAWYQQALVRDHQHGAGRPLAHERVLDRLVGGALRAVAPLAFASPRIMRRAIRHVFLVGNATIARGHPQTA